MTSARAAALVFVVSLAAYSFELGSAPLAGTEGHRALTAHQMVQSGQWLVPRLYDQVYLRKPPLAYWIIAIFETVTRHANEWVWRAPSAIGAAALGAALCLFTDLWFGEPAGIIAGFSHLVLVAVWQQNRSADIDSLNSLASVLGACGLIHLQVGQVRRRRLVVLLTGLAIGAALLIKGPQGLTIIGGAIIGPWMVRRKWSPGAMIALLIGVICFGIYALAAYWQIRAEHLSLDLSGLSEAADKGTPNGWKIIRAILVPPQVLLYALPVSLAIPMVWTDSRPLVRAILASVIVAFGLGLLDGIDNPRYVYVILPILCPLAGVALAANPKTVRVLPYAVAAMVVGMIPFALFARRLPSAYDAAQILKKNVPRGTVVVAGTILMDQPELFYYAGVGVTSDLAHATPGHWLVLKKEENDIWEARAKGQLSKKVVLWADKDVNLVWYGR